MEDEIIGELQKTEYYNTLMQYYEDISHLPLYRFNRSPDILIDDISRIYHYNKDHANSYTKRLLEQQRDFKSCEAIFAEVIIYAYYLELIYEGIIKSLYLYESDYDLKVELNNGDSNFFEIFSIMPDIKVWTMDEIQRGEMKAVEIKTHLQDAYASIRHKLLDKLQKQKQMTQPRRNFAVIELNDPRIAYDFTMLSSLSNGYKITFNTENMEQIEEGFDWSKSVFDEPVSSNLLGVIYFMMGDYNHPGSLFSQVFQGFGMSPDFTVFNNLISCGV